MENIINKWGYDLNVLKKGIENGKKLLQKTTLKKSQIEHIQKEILILEGFLQGNYNVEDPKEKTIYTFKELKIATLNQMKNIYYTLGPELINWLIILREEGIFNEYYHFNDDLVPIETQLEYTLKNYELHSKILLPYAKDLFYNNPTHIQIKEYFECTSYCEYFKILDKSLLLIDPTEEGFILNHETEHYIERSMKLPNNDPYLELGSIYFELLFNDLYYEKEGVLIPCKIEDAEVDLDMLVDYLIVIKKFAQTNFQVSNEDFKNIIVEKLQVIPEEIKEYLQEGIENDYMEDNIIYLISLLKAIELRNITLTSKQDSFDILNPFLSNKKLIFNPSKKLFKIYEDYVEEIKQKSLKK